MEQHSGDLAAGIRYLSVLHVGEDLVAIPLMHCVMVVVFLRVLRIVLRVDAVGKEAALALLHVCVFDLQWRGSQTHLYRQLFESVTLDALRNRDLEGRNNIR